MAEAVNYNKFLVDCVVKARQVAEPARTRLRCRVGNLCRHAGRTTDHARLPRAGQRSAARAAIEGLSRRRSRCGDIRYRSVRRDLHTQNVLEHIKNDQGGLGTARFAVTARRQVGRVCAGAPDALHVDGRQGRALPGRLTGLTQINRISAMRGSTSSECSYLRPDRPLRDVGLQDCEGRSDGTINPRALKLYDRAMFPVEQDVAGRHREAVRQEPSDRRHQVRGELTTSSWASPGRHAFPSRGACGVAAYRNRSCCNSASPGTTRYLSRSVIPCAARTSSSRKKLPVVVFGSEVSTR